MTMNRGQRWILGPAAVAALGIASAAGAATSTEQVNAAGTPRVSVVRGPVVTTLPQAADWTDLPGPTLTVSIPRSSAPALVQLRWFGKWACTDVGQLRLLADGAQTHEAPGYDEISCVYPRDNAFGQTVLDDFITLSAGQHTIKVQYKNQAVDTGTGQLIFQVFDWLLSAQATKVS